MGAPETSLACALPSTIVWFGGEKTQAEKAGSILSRNKEFIVSLGHYTNVVFKLGLPWR